MAFKTKRGSSEGLFMSNSSTFTLTNQDLVRQCISHMEGNELSPGCDIIADEKFHRYSIEGNRKKKDEWYVAYTGCSLRGNPYLICIYGSWKEGSKFEFKSWSDNKLLDSTEREELRKLSEQKRAETDARLKKEHDDVALIAKKIWDQSCEEPPSEAHLSYLNAKGVAPHHPARFGVYRSYNKDNKEEIPALIIPAFNTEGQLRTIQFIFKDNEGDFRKRFLTRGEKQGNFCIIGEITNGEPFIVAEGYATAVSIHAATQDPVVVAFDSGNLEPVIKNLRNKYKQNSITIAGDIDKNNVGQDKARNAARLHDCKVVFPRFPEGKDRSEDGSLYSDFNDLHQACGLQAVAEQLKAPIALEGELQLSSSAKGEILSEPDMRFDSFEVTRAGVYYIQPAKSENDSQEKIHLSSPIFPIARLRDADGKGHSLLLRMFDGERAHDYAMPRRCLHDWADINRTLLDLGQITPTSQREQKLFKDFLMKARPEKVLRCVDKAGWHDNQYVFPDGLVIGTKEEGEGAYPINSLYPEGIRQKGTLLEWQENVVSLCKGNSRLILALGLAFASACAELVKQDSGGINYKGKSSIGKTRCLLVAVSVWGAPEYKRNWRTTSNALEGICALYNDALLPMDEFGQADAKNSGEIAYMISQGAGKGRMSSNTSIQKLKTWRVLVISTGEVGLEEHMQESGKKTRAGQTTRIVDIPAEVPAKNAIIYGCFENIHGESDGASFANRLKEATSEYYGTAARAFIEKIVENRESTTKDLKFRIDDFVSDNAKNCSGQVARVASFFGLIYASLATAIKFGILGGYLSDDEVKEAVVTCYKDWLDERGTCGDLESHQGVERVIDKLREYSDSKFPFWGYTGDDKKTYAQIWGYQDNETFYVRKLAFKEYFCQGENPTAIARALHEAGYLIRKDKGYTVPRRKWEVGDKSLERFYMIRLDGDDEEEV